MEKQTKESIPQYITLSLTHRNTPKPRGLQLAACELPFMSEPMLKPWQGKAPDAVPALCCHSKHPPPSLFLNTASPSKKSPAENQSSKSRAFHAVLHPPSTRSFYKLQKSHWPTRSNQKAGAGGRYGGAQADTLSHVQLPTTCWLALLILTTLWQQSLCPVPLQSHLCAFRTRVKCSL